VTTRLLSDVRALLDTATSAYAGTQAEPEVAALRRRLDEPLRIAIAGKVKAGKSTLLNALVGEELAPTDAGECTRIVTWYVDGIAYRVTLHPIDGGAPRQVPFTRDDGAISCQLGTTPAEHVERLVIEWPSASLRTMTLIDTPGIASLRASVSALTHDFLTSSDVHHTPADAVLYLMRHLHGSDVSFLETFHDQEFSQPTPINAVAVLSRADEVGVGRLDAMESAARIAQRYRSDPKVRRLCQTVVPVAGLLAQSGHTLRESEYRAFEQLRQVPAGELENLLLAADRFVHSTTSAGLTPIEREHLVERFGMFGVRLAISLLQSGAARNSSELADALVARSGLDELQAVLRDQFGSRADVLKARSALLGLQGLLRSIPPASGDAAALAADVERVVAGAHELTEIRLLNALRSGAVDVGPDEEAAMERVLGATGSSVAARLGLAEGASHEELRAALDTELARWQRRAENPLSSREVADAARDLVRTLSGIYVTLQPG
jgi:predicted GTPase